MNRFRYVDERFIVGLFESNCHQGHSGRESTMKHKSGLARAVLASLGIVVSAALSGCGHGNNPQAEATPANMTMATSAATAQLPPGEEPTATNNAPDAPAAAAQPRFAQIVAVQPITQSVTSSKPRQVCRDEQVAVPETYKDKHQIGGAVVGGAAAGAFAGHEIQKRHQENNATHTETRNVCHTVTDKTTATKTVGYD